MVRAASHHSSCLGSALGPPLHRNMGNGGCVSVINGLTFCPVGHFAPGRVFWELWVFLVVNVVGYGLVLFVLLVFVVGLVFFFSDFVLGCSWFHLGLDFSFFLAFCVYPRVFFQLLLFVHVLVLHVFCLVVCG